jgi:hypothetical protein
MSQEQERENLELLIDHCPAAWEEDLASARNILDQLRDQLAKETGELERIVTDRHNKQTKYDRELNLVTTDLFNYMRNNEKTLVQVKLLEKRAKVAFEALKADNKSTPELERQASNLLTDL